MRVAGHRIRPLKEGISKKGAVVYWMSRDQRIADNWALIYAQDAALERKAPLAIAFVLAADFLGATLRQYRFMMKGLRDLHRRLERLQIPFFLLCGDPAREIVEFIVAHDVALLVTDFDPLRIKTTWKRDVCEGVDIPVHEVDAHNVVPCWRASHKQEYGAYTIRPKIERLVREYTDPYPVIEKHPYSWQGYTITPDWSCAENSLAFDSNVEDLSWIIPGEDAAHDMLREFIHNKLSVYDSDRNDPCRTGQSDLSPYLHFGQLSAQRVACAVESADTRTEARKAFLEELIVRKELADNFCLYNANYDRFDGFPAWAKKTLDEHRKDVRPYIYSVMQFEHGLTHDNLWNAAQMEMVKRGKMHGYLRMYWAKKILEWTASPEEAMEIAIYLNDKYELDGRDPNGYAGIAWSIGGVHDRPWGARSVFGAVRYMSYNGCKAKFDVMKYIDDINALQTVV